MESIGKKLRTARESKGISIELLSEKTRIRRDFIAAMENDDFAFLPRPYVRGFLRQVATEVGLDPAELLAELDSPGATPDEHNQPSTQEAGDTSEDTPEAAANTPGPAAGLQPNLLDQQRHVAAGAAGPVRKAKKVGLRSDPAQPVSGSPYRGAPQTGPGGRRLEWTLAAAACLLLISILVVYAKFSGSVKQSSEFPVEELPLEVAIQASDSLADPLKSAQPEPLQLEAVADQTTWMRVVIDQTDTSEVILHEGQRTSWKALQRFDLRFGNAGGVRLLLNGESLEPAGRSGQVVSVTITHDGMVERRVHAPRPTPPDTLAPQQAMRPAVAPSSAGAQGGRHGAV